MTKKKRELIEILLDNVKPEDWPEDLPYAAQDASTFRVFFYSQEPKRGGERYWKDAGESYYIFGHYEICKHWNKTIVHRDEFMKRWNKRSVAVEAKTPQQLALEKFGTDWHDNEGVKPELDEVLIDIRLSETGVYNKEYASTWVWDLSESNFIEEWRIHSDEKESQAEIAANKLAFDDGPMASEPVRKSPLETQIGGNHYTKLAIQPMRYSMENGLDALQHTVIKYVTRFRDKNGIEDLEKAKHCIDMLIEYERSLM